MYCTACGTQLQDGTRFCTNCGAAMGQATAAPPQQQAWPTQPPAMPDTRVGGGNDIVYAGFVRRFAALFVDGLILIVPIVASSFVIGLLLGVVFKNADQQSAQAAAQFAGFVIAVAIKLFYFAFQESSRHQATFGKRALGIKVTDNLGQRLSLGRAAGRYFASALSYLTLYIGFLMAGFTERKRALHDMVAGTLVVDRWAYTDHPERQQFKASGCLIAFVVGFLLVIPVTAIFAAIAISQYQDYVIRSQVSEGAALADGVKTAVAEFYNNNGRFPGSNASTGLALASSIKGNYVSSVDVGTTSGTITVTYSNTPPNKANSAIDGKTLLFEAFPEQGSIIWHCKSSNLHQKWCASSCECGG